MGKVIIYGSISVDGFATGPDDDLERLHGWMWDGSEPDEFMRSFTSTGAIIFGKRTWDLGQQYWDDATFHAPVFVLTHKSEQPTQDFGSVSTFVNSIEDAVAQAKAVAGANTVHIMGSPTVAAQALEAGLVDELQIHVVAMLIGNGIRFFGGVEKDLELVS